MRQYYQQKLNSQQLTKDPAQLEAVLMLDALQHAIEAGNTPQSIYLYGPVGRGKTMLMDMFYNTLNSNSKQRLHFHHFMQQVHQEMNHIQGKPNPLSLIAKSWSKNVKVLCFDEFFVTDIGDAMIMARLFEQLFIEGVVLVATSNCHPQALYHNGLQRDRFLPTIALLEKQCKIVNISGEYDHRFAHGFNTTHYYQNNKIAFNKKFAYAGGSFGTAPITLCRREITLVGIGQKVAMFDFMAICSAPRATADYMELANKFSALFIANIPQMGKHALNDNTAQGIEDGYQRTKNDDISYELDDQARRFIALVDECYERKCLIVINAQVDLTSLYVGKKLAFEFERTKSRLVEMQNWSLSFSAASPP